MSVWGLPNAGWGWPVAEAAHDRVADLRKVDAAAYGDGHRQGKFDATLYISTALGVEMGTLELLCSEDCEIVASALDAISRGVQLRREALNSPPQIEGV